MGDGSRSGAGREKSKSSGLPPCNLCLALNLRREPRKESCSDKDLYAREALGENGSIHLEKEENHTSNGLKVRAENFAVIIMVFEMHKGVNS